MYLPSDKMIYSRCGRSGLKLPRVSMGLWQNFGHQGRFSDMEEMVHTAFDLGITHFDLANNYGNPYNGSAEENFGRILDRGMREFRDELCISTKADVGRTIWRSKWFSQILDRFLGSKFTTDEIGLRRHFLSSCF